jgi:hypothetical protein
MQIIINISREGIISFLYDDRLRGLMKNGDAKITRASHVEATADNQWNADMAPSGGGVLGPFKTRQEALDAEVEWLNDNVLTAK